MFTTPCFIRKNTPELIKKLEELGYKKNTTYLEHEHNLYAGGGIYSSANFIDKYYFDCETNEELFLALAALRDDTDKNQWIIDEANEAFGLHDAFMICDKDDMNDRIVYTHYRKATVKEIIEHFKNDKDTIKQ